MLDPKTSLMSFPLKLNRHVEVHGGGWGLVWQTYFKSWSRGEKVVFFFFLNFDFASLGKKNNLWLLPSQL